MSKVITQTAWAIITVSYLSLFALGLLDNVRGPFFQDIITDLKLTDTQSAFFFASASFASFLGTIIVGKIDRFISRLNILRIGLLILAAGFFSITTTHSLFTLVLACFAFGIGFGVINVSQNLLVLEGATEHMRRQLFSGLHGMYAVASLVAPMIAALFFRLHLSWREAFQFFSFAPVAAFLVSLYVPAGRTQPKHVEARRPSKEIRLKVFFYGLILSLYVLGELSVSTRLSLYLRRELGFTAVHASIYLALFFFALLVGRFLFTFIKFHKLTSERIIQLALALSLVSIVVGLTLNPYGFVFSGLTMAPVFGVFLDHLTARFGVYSTYAISHAIGFGALYVVCLHLLMGALTDKVGIQFAMGLGAVSMVLSLVGLFIIEMRQPRENKN